MSDKPTGAGKGDKARNNYSREFRNNYDEINWGGAKSKTVIKKEGREVVVRKNGRIIGIQG